MSKNRYLIKLAAMSKIENIANIAIPAVAAGYVGGKLGKKLDKNEHGKKYDAKKPSHNEFMRSGITTGAVVGVIGGKALIRNGGARRLAKSKYRSIKRSIPQALKNRKTNKALQKAKNDPKFQSFMNKVINEKPLKPKKPKKPKE